MVELVRFCVFILNNSTQNCTIPFVWIHSSTMQPFRWDDLFGGLGVLYEYLLVELNHVLANKIKWKKKQKKNEHFGNVSKNNNLTRESGRQIQRYVACKRGCHQRETPQCPRKALQKRLKRWLALPRTTHNPPQCVNKHQRALWVENVPPEPTALFNLIPLPLPRFHHRKPNSSLICINLHSFKSLSDWLLSWQRLCLCKQSLRASS